MTATLADDIRLLHDLLDEAVRRQLGEATAGLEHELRDACHRADQTGDEALRDRVLTRLAEQPDEVIDGLLRSLTTRFHLRNKAEQLEIARINRQRERDATSDRPRAESIAEAVARLKAAGRSLDDVLALLERLDIQPTLTAHPTEARRRTILRKQQEIAAIMEEMERGDPTPPERRHLERRLRRLIVLVLSTDEVRARRLRVIEEARNGVYFLTTSIWNAVPRLYRDLRDALEEQYGVRPDTPVFLRYRSWIGGDRDGNPNVTAEVTRQTLALHRREVLELYRASLLELRRDLSISSRRVAVPGELLDSIEEDAQLDLPVDAEQRHHLVHEPFRVKVLNIVAKLDAAARVGYTAENFVEDLRLLQRALRESGLNEVADEGRLPDLLVQAQTFGFHLTSLDIRQHSDRHAAAVAELLRLAQVEGEYESLDEMQRLDLLRRELSHPRPLLPPNATLSAQTQEVLDVLDVVREALTVDAMSIGGYVVSMTHEVSDLLEVLLLMKEAGLWSRAQESGVGGRESGVGGRGLLDLVPLFETIDDLRRAATLLRDLFDDPVYADYLRERKNFQEIMLGYSDSNKDGGYWAANWALHRAQEEIAHACAERGEAKAQAAQEDGDSPTTPLTDAIDFRLFHGRGGTVGRGGGRASRAILAAPAVSRNGRIRYTEQGEVISFRYALAAIARRHLEQIVNAMMIGVRGSGLGVRENGDSEPSIPDHGFIDRIFDGSMSAYRQLVEHPEFWEWYTQGSPVRHISALPIASRPAARTGRSLDFENIRAIPWVFAWTQMRCTVPGWYGVGSALHDLLQDEAGAETLRRLYRESEFIRAVINNAQQEMARARLTITRWYAQRAGSSSSPATSDTDAIAPEGGDTHAIVLMIEEEFDLARRAILAITGQRELLDNNPVIAESIRQRNPDTDLLNLIQVELLRRHREAVAREASEEEIAALQTLIHGSINAIAAAMQSTG